MCTTEPSRPTSIWWYENVNAVKSCWFYNYLLSLGPVYYICLLFKFVNIIIDSHYLDLISGYS